MGYSGDSNSAQFGEDTGIKFSKKTKKIPVLSGLLKNKNYVSVLPEGFVESLPGEGNFLTDKAAESDPELTESRRQQVLEKSRRDTEAAGLEADKLERERREFLLSQPELTDEEAERLAREKLTKQQASQKVREDAAEQERLAAQEARSQKNAGTQAEDPEVVAKRAEANRTYASKIAEYLKKSKIIPYIGFVGAGIAAQQKGAEAKEAFEEGDYGTAVKRGAQAVEELVSPLPITTGDLEEISKKTPEQEKFLSEQRAIREERLQRRSERARSQLNKQNELDDQMNNLIPQP